MTSVPRFAPHAHPCRSRLYLGLALLALLGSTSPSWAQANGASPAQQIPQAQSAPPGHQAQLDRNGVLILVRSALLAVDQANRTGNYTVLRDLGAPGFQAANTASRLSEIFANLRSQNLDLSGVAVLEPQLTVLPTIEANGMMRLAGVFPSVPLQVNFELIFAPIEGRWRVFGISINLGSAAPAAPMPSDPPPAIAIPDAKAAPVRPGDKSMPSRPSR